MQAFRLIFVVAIVVIGSCVYNPIIVDSADFTSAQKGKSSSDGCKGPFGVDSQKILGNSREDKYSVGDYISTAELGDYNIGVVSDIVDLEKNADGTWYIAKCKLSSVFNEYLSFTSPYPQQHDLKDGDIIAYSTVMTKISGFRKMVVNHKLLENISSQSVNCKIDTIKGLSTPVRSGPGKRFGPVTGVVMAVNVGRNSNPEPDNPDDFQITKVVMKCADGNLYIVNLKDKSDYERYKRLAQSLPAGHKDKERYRVLKGVNLPSHKAFGEGDVVTLEQLEWVIDGPLGVFDINSFPRKSRLPGIPKLTTPSYLIPKPNHLSFVACYIKDVKRLLDGNQ